MTVTDAVDLAAEGHLADGYAALDAGLKRAEEIAAEGVEWGLERWSGGRAPARTTATAMACSWRRYCQVLWIRSGKRLPFQAAMSTASGWLGGTASPSGNRLPSRTGPTRCGALIFRQRCCELSISLNAIDSPALREPAPFVWRARPLAGAKAASIGLVVRRWTQCAA